MGWVVKNFACNRIPLAVCVHLAASAASIIEVKLSPIISLEARLS